MSDEIVVNGGVEEYLVYNETDGHHKLEWEAVKSTKPTEVTEEVQIKKDMNMGSFMNFNLYLSFILVCVYLGINVVKWFKCFVNDDEFILFPEFAYNLENNNSAVLLIILIIFVFTLLWFIGLPIALVIASAFGIRYIVRMKKKLNNICSKKEIKDEN